MRVKMLPCIIICGLAGIAGAQSIYSVGIAPGRTGSSVRAISADGAFATGYSVTSQPGQAGYGTGFVWSASQGRYDFGLEAGLPPSTRGLAISDDGGAVIGTSFSLQTGNDAFRWSGPGTYQSLHGLDPITFGTDISGNGGIVIGHSEIGPGVLGHAWRWTQSDGYQPIGTTITSANAISRDGSTIVGSNYGIYQAYRWTEATGMVTLPSLPGHHWSDAHGTNFDGSIVVGTSSGQGTRGVRWHSGQAFDLGPPPIGYDAFIPNAVSDDGSIIVGQLGGAWAAGVWTPDRGIETLHSYLTAMGVDVSGWYFADCPAVSADGRTLGGSGWEPSGLPVGFVVTVPAPATCIAFGLFFVPQRRRRTPTAIPDRIG